MNENQPGQRFHTTVILAMSVDGKIADVLRSPARFGSTADKHHLETQIAQADAVLFGAGTLRAYGTTLRITQPHLLAQRQHQGKPLQPIHIVCSASGDLDPHYPFFRQPVPRWLLTTRIGAQRWQGLDSFTDILIGEAAAGKIDWRTVVQALTQRGIQRVAVLGGGELVAGLIAAHLVDELWITVCPLILGGRAAPTLVDGDGLAAQLAPRVELVEVKTIDSEVFLRYRVIAAIADPLIT